MRDIISIVGQQALEYIANLRGLPRSLCGQASIAAAITVYRVFDMAEDMGKSILPRTRSFLLLANIVSPRGSRASQRDDVCQSSVRERCLDGTRGEIVDAITGRALHADCTDEKEQIRKVPNPSARVLIETRTPYPSASFSNSDTSSGI